MRISDWSSDVCSSDLVGIELHPLRGFEQQPDPGRDGVEIGAAEPIDRAGVERLPLPPHPVGVDAAGAQRQACRRLQPQLAIEGRAARVLSGREGYGPAPPPALADAPAREDPTR